jgi:hypothetical protein
MASKAVFHSPAPPLSQNQNKNDNRSRLFVPDLEIEEYEKFRILNV